MKFKNITLLLLVVFSCKLSFSQQNDSPEYFNRTFVQAETFFSNEEYNMALPLYMKLLLLDSTNSNTNFKIGVCHINSTTRKKESIPYFEKAVKNVAKDYKEGNPRERRAPLFAYNYLANAYHHDYQFTKAVETYKKALEGLNLANPADKLVIDDINHQIEMCNNAVELIKNPISIKLENLGPEINSEFPDYSPVLSADESMIIYTSRRPNTTGSAVDENDGMFFEDVYIAYRKDSNTWNASQNMGTPINTVGHDATIGLSVDGSQLLLFRNDNADGNIYISELQGNQWQIPQKLNDNVNTKDWEPSASVTAEGDLLYFSSNRPGGFGGRDIYRSKRLPNGQWAKPINLGPKINTPYDEDAPMIHPSGQTMFFSSMGHKSMGGFDIFFSSVSDSGVWETPINMGYPVNTPDDDIFFVPTADNRRAYFSSFREGGYGEKDIYMITFPDQREAPLTVYKGEIKGGGSGDIAEGVQITVTDNETGELVGVYYPNSKTGKYLFILKPGRNYNISYEAEGFLFHSENLAVMMDSSYTVINKPINLSPITVGQKIVLNNIFFDTNKSDLKPESKTELDKLENLLRKNPRLIVELSGHTDSRGKKEANLKLSQQRAQAVVDYLSKAGIDSKRMKAQGYGDSQPVAPNKTADGKDNVEGMAKNRRTELKTIGMIEKQ